MSTVRCSCSKGSYFLDKNVRIPVMKLWKAILNFGVHKVLALLIINFEVLKDGLMCKILASERFFDMDFNIMVY